MMETVPGVLWTKSYEGRRPGILLGEDRVLFHYFTGPENVSHLGERVIIHHSPKPTDPCELVCFDLRGQELWGRSGCCGLTSLPDNRFVVSDHKGVPHIIDGDGRALASWEGQCEIERAVRHHNMFALQAGSTVWVTDLNLRPVNELNWPDKSTPAIDCFVDGAFRWVEGGKLWKRTVLGKPECFGSVPLDLVEQATPGNRRFDYQWQIAFDEDEGVFFLANNLHPHVLICLDHQGNANWCSYLSPLCCGGVGYRLPNGLYVTSSGCGGILSWLDTQGNIQFRSDPPPTPNLAYAFSNVVTVLSDGRSLIWGPGGIVAFDPAGDLLWKAKVHGSQYEVSEERGLLFGCGQAKGESEERTNAVLEAVDGL